MADATDSKSVGATRVGSTPTFGTILDPTHPEGRPVTTEDSSFGGWRACDVCGEPIATIEEGGLVLRAPLMAERRTALDELVAQEGTSGEIPGLVPWDWGHLVCFEALEPLHTIEGPQMDTLPRMMARTLQLMDEAWFAETAWEDAVRRFYQIPFE